MYIDLQDNFKHNRLCQISIMSVKVNTKLLTKEEKNKIN